MPNERIERVLNALLPAEDVVPERLHQAMRYACLGGGKRIRARLVYATGELYALPLSMLDPAAAAVEMIHAYSLIHDDLPAMDNDALRRGKPTVHVAYCEATAILAGDALQALAYETLATAEWPSTEKIQALQLLLTASGSRGMCGGQQLDMQAGGQMLDIAALEQLHALKTGALIKAAILIPATLAKADAQSAALLAVFADNLGLAFQIQDDILDVEASTEQLGKSAGKDLEQAKATYPALLGLAGAKSRLAQLSASMHEQLAHFGGRGEALRALATYTVGRQY